MGGEGALRLAGSPDRRVAWGLALLAAASDLGRRLALDGLIMRDPSVRLMGYFGFQFLS